MEDLSPRPGDLEAIETASVDELRALQAERLRWSVRHAYENVPHYRRSFDAAGVRPDDVTELDDLARLPFTTKADLRENYPFGMFAVPREQVVRVHASSGTTGKPTVVGYTKDDIDMWATVMARSIRAAGGRAGHIAHIAYGYGLFTGGLGAHYGAEKLGCTVVPVSGGMTERQVQLIAGLRARPDHGHAVVHARHRRRDASARASTRGRRRSRSASSAPSPGPTTCAREMEERLDMHAVDIYGLSEVIGPGVASECVETKDGLHVWEDHFYPEIIDPETGEVLPDGEEGELVFTSLTKQAMPVIRYRTRDLTRLLPGTARTMRRIEKITGRTDDMIILRGVNLFPTQIEELILRTPELSPHFQCVLERSGNLDALTVVVERREDASERLRPRRPAYELQTAGEELHRRLHRRPRRRAGRRRAVDGQDEADRRQRCPLIGSRGRAGGPHAPRLGGRGVRSATPASTSGGGWPGLGDQRQHVVRRHRVAVAVGHHGVPADLAVVGVRARGDLLDGQRHRDRVAGLDRGEEAQVVDAEVGQHRAGVGVDEQPGGQRHHEVAVGDDAAEERVLRPPPRGRCGRRTCRR